MASIKPNIVLFMVDQLTAFVLNSYGGSECRTPNIDKLAARGTVFDAAYCAYPLCLPSRCAMMTGRLPSRIGAFDNGAELPASVPTFTHYLRNAGYYTCLSGKMHFVGPDQYHGFEDRLTPEVYPADMSWTPAPKSGSNMARTNDGPEAGVSTIDTVKDAGPVARSMQIDYDEDVVHQATRALYDRARGSDQRPFFLTISLTQPHDPYVTTPTYWEQHQDKDIAPPRVPHIPVEQRDPHSKSLYYHYSQDKCALDDDDVRRARRGYYGMIAHIDDHLGRVCDVLEDCGYSKDTVIIFTSDHGDMIGERGMWFKKTLYEPAIHVPLIVSLPGQSPSRVPDAVSLLDLFPTLLDVAGIADDRPADQRDGVSLLPQIQGSANTRPVLIEHIDGGTDAPRVCVRKGRWKLIISRAYPPMLYDLESDPLELNEIAQSRSDITAELTKLAEASWPLDGLQDMVQRSQGARKLIDNALAQGRQEIWDHMPNLPQHYVRRGDAFPDVERRGYLQVATKGGPIKNEIDPK